MPPAKKPWFVNLPAPCVCPSVYRRQAYDWLTSNHDLKIYLFKTRFYAIFRRKALGDF